jgi:hypothetical protein
VTVSTRNEHSHSGSFESPADPDDDDVVGPGTQAPLPDDPEAPEADALDQAEEVTPTPRPGEVPRNPEVPEADAWEQSIEVPFDDDEPL